MYKRKLDWKKLDENERQGIIRKVFDYFRNLARSVADRLQQMLRLGRVDVKKSHHSIAGGYSYTRIGQLTSTDGLKEALGTGNISVTFAEQ